MPSSTDRTSRTASRRRTSSAPSVSFAYKLALNRWMLGLFGVDRFERLAEHLRHEALEGLDEDNIHRFHRALCSQLFNLTGLSTDQLLEYDQNIVRHTRRINERRVIHGQDPIAWKYFQYLALLFTEVYLDRYFRDPDGLLASLNEQVEALNASMPESDHLARFDSTGDAWRQLNKLAYWMATGSGKTLLMHVNILQYRHYLAKHGRTRELNRIILLTPNEGLSRQHLVEFEISGIDAELFNKDGRGLFTGHSVEILEVTKLKDEMGDKTVAVDAFEGNNLVLVDEGHRGASSGEEGAWMRFRNQLCEKGFSFEYSATFAQAVKGNRSLIDTYARCILFDYSYRFFYGDGFGKDYHILNLDEDTQSNHLELYMTACLLTFFQQQRLYCGGRAEFSPFNIEKPLWIFVGGKVTATLATRDASDIIEILRFLARYVGERTESTGRIERVLNQGLLTADGRNLFSGRFKYLIEEKMTAAQVYDETLSAIFNARAGGALYIENLRGATGEIALRIGDNEPFGVINVGDDAKLCKLCEEKGLNVSEREFSGSLFHDINKPNSTITMLIGSRKFTEGWNSWRVATMGLMNVGASEGSQIIQLFGRGVRLKGYGRSLKRSGHTELPPDAHIPRHIGLLETLGIFGIHADYMAQFRDFLKDEGLPTNEDRYEMLLPIIKNLGTQKLKIIRLRRTINGVSTEFGDAFRKLGPVPTLAPPDPTGSELQRNPVLLNWYPRIQAMKSTGVTGGEAELPKHHAHLTARHISLIDMDRVYFELSRFKAERGWYNLNLTRERLIPLLLDQSWYRLLIPEEELAFDSYDKVRVWEEIAVALLKKYTERYYTYRKREWELPHLEYRDLDKDDPNFLNVKDAPDQSGYRVIIDRSQTDIISKLEELRGHIEKGRLKPWEFAGLKAVWFGRHLYEPLLYLEGKAVEISPVPLNPGEYRFIEDLKAHHGTHPDYFRGKELYLLRNLSKGRGVGFFEAANFYPDFILWILMEEKQHIAFIDPKGMRNLEHITSDPKITFHRTIKEIERRLGDEKVHLHSFIISNTPSHIMKMHWSVDKSVMSAHHILFQEEDMDTYIGQMFETLMVDIGKPGE